MPTFEITSPDGARYRVDAPDGASEQDALKYVQDNHASLQALKPEAATPDLPAWAGGKGKSDSPQAPSERPSVLQRFLRPANDALNGPDSASATAKSYFSRSPSDTLNTVNQAVVGPLATVFVDAPNALLRGGAGGIAGVAEALGLPGASSDRLERDLNTGIDATLADVGMGGPGAGVKVPAIPQAAKDVASRAGDFAAAAAAKGATAAKNGAWKPGDFANAAVEAADIPGNARADASAEKVLSAAGKSELKATNTVEKSLNRGRQATGTTAEEIINNLNRARELGKPATLIDVGGPAAERLGGTAARRDEGAMAAMRGFFDKRDETTPKRMTDDVHRDLGSGPSAYRTEQVIRNRQQDNARTNYAKAFEGRGLAPLKDQFTAAFNEASKAEVEARQQIQAAGDRVEAAQAKLAQTGYDPYRATGVNPDLKALERAEADLRKAQSAAATAARDKQTTLENLRQAQDDIAAGKTGAVWSPQIQRILNDPEAKGGLAEGLASVRRENVINGTYFDPSEYALTIDEKGNVITDANGNPAVGKVPNLRLLDAVKRGFDHIIASERQEDGRLTTRGREVDAMRRSLLAELDRMSPEYMTAHGMFASDAAAIDATRWGRIVADTLGAPKALSGEEIADRLRGLTPGETDLARYGLVDGILTKVKAAGFNGDEAKRVANSILSKEQMEPFFKSRRDYENFVESVGIERGFFDRKGRVVGNSMTAERQAADQQNVGGALKHGYKTIKSGLGADLVGFLENGRSTLRHLGLLDDKDLNQSIVEILTDIGIKPEIDGEGNIILPAKGPESGLSMGFRAPR